MKSNKLSFYPNMGMTRKYFFSLFSFSASEKKQKGA